jgi:hypothetical protein
MPSLSWLWLAVVSPIIFVVLAIVGYRLNGRLIGCLRSRHQSVWVDLGRPTIAGALLTVGMSWSVLSTGRRSYVSWLFGRGYDGLDDPELSALGAQHEAFTWVLVALVLLWVAVAWFGGYIHARQG